MARARAFDSDLSWSMTQFELTKALLALIEKSTLTEGEKEKLRDADTVSHLVLIDFHRRCKPCSSLLELIKTTRMVIPNKNVKNESLPKTQEFLKSMEILKLKARDEEYRRLVGASPTVNALFSQEPDDKPFNPAREIKETKSHITTIFNIFISVLSVVYAIWYWTDTSWKIRDSYRVLLCLFFGILILVAEVVVYIGYLNKIEDARKREQNKKEVKRVIRSVTLN